jgi:hypothetical protein
VQCRIVDLSLEGCRVRTLERFPTGAGVHVEVTFKVKGIAFRFGGAIQWMDGRNSFGIHFVGVPWRRREELVEVLGEVEADIAATATKEAAVQLAAEQQAAAEGVAEELGKEKTRPPPEVTPTGLKKRLRRNAPSENAESPRNRTRQPYKAIARPKMLSREEELLKSTGAQGNATRNETNKGIAFLETPFGLRVLLRPWPVKGDFDR